MEATFRHFSHHHPLVRTNSPPAANTSCFGCNLNILSAKDYYRCKFCTFNLHQACYNTPRKIRHPGHPVHHLNLLVMPSSAKGSFKCKACGQNVTGFYYSCAECGFCYHILCSALPLSVSIYSHSHTLKLEYSLPYYFECDLCQKPCYNGWLYRCQLCEFDTHLACAIANQRIQSLQYPSIPHPDPLTRQKMYSSALKIDCDSESNELMQLVSQGIARDSRKSTTRPGTIHGAVAGWHDTLHSPKQNLSMRNGRIEYSGGPFQTKPDNIVGFSTNSGGHLEHLDHSNMQSGDLSTLPSYQFSDHSYFSIDIARSPLGFDLPNQESNEANYRDSKVVQDIKQVISYRNGSMLNRLEPPKEEDNKPDFSLLFMAPESRVNEAFLKRGGSHTEMESSQKNETKEIGSRCISEFKDQSIISDKVSSVLADLTKYRDTYSSSVNYN
ncbi:hypothetical protein JRO89_XS12G0150400 [Xanthoceras sorbifolium]|uniref:DC1 domain-containing protein n=1 Tax=Xanthoceras sorbifolium TaxID=99658 RepID=A0ABQ8HCQ7_9ROSI|nr:hypothetical protein JRO89_XS12G0150400 [Xanthoceras sorbifolium]